jgi:hypothetical protein
MVLRKHQKHHSCKSQAAAAFPAIDALCMRQRQAYQMLQWAPTCHTAGTKGTGRYASTAARHACQEQALTQSSQYCLCYASLLQDMVAGHE